MASYKSVGFGDERRALADTHKPRVRNERSEREKILSWRAPPDGRKGENSRDLRDERSSRDNTKEVTQNRSALKLNTDVPMAPRTQMSPAKDTPTSGRPSTARTSSGAIPTQTATPTRPWPKSSDPSLQGIFEVLYKSYEIVSKRAVLAWHREKKKKEMEARRVEANNTPPGSSALREVQKMQRSRDEEELKTLTERYSIIDKDHRGALETIAAIIQRAQPPPAGLPTAPPTTDPAVAELAAKFADLEEKQRQAQDEIQKLQTAHPRWSELEEKLSQAQEAIAELQTCRDQSKEDHEQATEVCRALMSKQNELEKDKSALAKENAQLKERVATLQEDFVEMRNAMLSKASKVNSVGARASAQSSTSSGNAQQSIEALPLMVDELRTRVTTAETSLETVFNVSAELSSVKCSVAKVEGRVTEVEGAMSRVDTELAAVRGTLLTMDTNLVAVQGTASTMDNILAAVQGRISTVESELSTIRERTENLDFKTLDDIGDQWTIHNIGNSVPNMKQKLEALENDLAQMREMSHQHQNTPNSVRREFDQLSKSMKDRSVQPVQEPTPPVPDDDLKKQVMELQRKYQPIAQLDVAVANTGQQIKKIQENLQKLHKYTEDSMSKQADLFGEMIDEISGRVTEVEGARHGFVKMVDDLTPRLIKLETTANKPSASFCEDVQTKLAAVEQKLAALPDMEARASTQRNIQLLAQKIKTMEVHLNDGGRRLEAVTLGIEALNDQLSNITTRHLFDLIVRHVDQNHHGYGSRISSLETKLASTQNAIDRANESLQRLHEGRAARSLDPKRSASPVTRTAENNAKRMRTASKIL